MTIEYRNLGSVMEQRSSATFLFAVLKKNKYFHD